MNSKHFVIATTLILTAVPCFAHDTWLLPRETNAEESKTLTVDLTSGMFPKLESGIKADRVAKGGWRTPSATGKLDRYEEDAASLVMHMTPRGDGTAVLYLTLKPKEIELTADQVAEYFDEIGASQSLRDDWASRGSGAQYHETYTKHAKAFVRVGSGADEDATCRRAVGQAVELIPLRDPTALSVGDSLVVKVVRGGNNELEQFVVGIVCGKTGDTEMRRTNEAGMVAFPITDSGWWMVRATELRRKSNGSYESDMCTMTFFVQ